MRLDAFISENFSGISRSRAKALITSGAVTVGGKQITKPAFDVSGFDVSEVVLSEETLPYVSRGGLKLEGALSAFGVSPRGRVCIDVGASTGGFTDCLLQGGAAAVYAIDSGHGQLSTSLERDSRVVSAEGFNARELRRDSFNVIFSLAVADLSFISQTYVIPAIASVLDDGGEYIGLIKPQFECGREALGKGGIVRDKKYHKAAIKKVLDSLAETGFTVKALIASPIKGGDGNREFLFHAIKDNKGIILVSERDISELISEK